VSTPKFRPLERSRAYQAVAARIEEMILQGELRPGDRLPSERDLSTQMQVSRPTVREAMRALENTGIVALRPNDPTGGAVVRMPDGAGLERSLVDLARYSQVSLGDLIGFRMLLETASCHLAARRNDPDLIAEIRVANEAVARAMDGPAAEFAAADVDFHAAVARASGNKMLELCTGAVKSAMATLIGDAMSRSPDEVKRDFVRRHNAIIRAIEAGDAGEAARRARQDLVDYYVPLLEGEEAESVNAMRELNGP